MEEANQSKVRDLGCVRIRGMVEQDVCWLEVSVNQAPTVCKSHAFHNGSKYASHLLGRWHTFIQYRIQGRSRNKVHQERGSASGGQHISHGHNIRMEQFCLSLALRYQSFAYFRMVEGEHLEGMDRL
jgi:hypothetical protein